MLFYLGKCAGFDAVCDKCDFSEHLDNDDIFYARHAARVKGWRIRIESNAPRMEGGYIYLCPKCREREESYPSKEDGMTEPKGPFDAEGMLEHLRDGCLWDSQARNEFRDKYPKSIYPQSDEDACPTCDKVAAILKDWPKWEPLIEAAGKISKKERNMALGILLRTEHPNIRALLETLPDGGKK